MDSDQVLAARKALKEFLQLLAHVKDKERRRAVLREFWDRGMWSTGYEAAEAWMEEMTELVWLDQEEHERDEAK